MRALLPLHKPKCAGRYHQQLGYCVTQVPTQLPQVHCLPWSPGDAVHMDLGMLLSSLTSYPEQGHTTQRPLALTCMVEWFSSGWKGPVPQSRIMNLALGNDCQNCKTSNMSWSAVICLGSNRSLPAVCRQGPQTSGASCESCAEVLASHQQPKRSTLPWGDRRDPWDHTGTSIMYSEVASISRPDTHISRRSHTCTAETCRLLVCGAPLQLERPEFAGSGFYCLLLDSNHRHMVWAFLVQLTCEL